MKACQINCYSQVRWHYSVFDGLILTFLSLVLIYTPHEQKFDLLDAQKVLLQMKEQERLLTEVAGKFAFSQVNVSKQMLSYHCLVGLVCKILFYYHYDDQHVEVSIKTSISLTFTN